MYYQLEEINRRPETYSTYSPGDIWNDPHISKMLLMCHMDSEIDMASRNHRFIDKSVNWINSLLPLKHRSVCDFGCGPGLYTTRFAKLGARVTGIDISLNSITHAEKISKIEKLDIKYVNDDYLNWTTEIKFDLITLIYCDFCSLSPLQRSQLLKKFKGMLNPDGYIVLDVYSLNSFSDCDERAYYESNMHNGFWSASDYYGFTNSFKYLDERVTLDKYTIVNSKGIKTFYNWLQYYDRDDIISEFKSNGLKVVEIYSDVAGTPFSDDTNEMAILAAMD